MKKTSERLYDSAKNIWNAYHTHPFVTGIKDGTLPVEKFRYFMIQDYLYLFEYAKVFSFGVLKSKDEDIMRFFAKNSANVLDGEMSIHRSYMKRLGITENDIKGARAAHANKSYTSYMLSEASVGGELEILAAVLACFWSYAEIGSKIAVERPDMLNHEVYGEWIDGYSCSEYRTANENVINKFDELCGKISEERYKKLEEIFVECSIYEMDFWNMAWNMEE